MPRSTMPSHLCKKLLLLLPIILLPLILSGCFLPNSIVETERLAVQLQEQGSVSSTKLQVDELALHYVERVNAEGNAVASNVLVIFIHGTPGDWKIFSRQLDDPLLVQRAQLISIDRPGWGASVFEDGRLLTDFDQQAHYLLNMIEHVGKDKNVILVGHSLGASLTAYLALNYSENIHSAMLIAGDLTPMFRSVRWYNAVASWTLINAILPDDLRRANDEVLALPEQMAKVQENWKNLDVPLLVIQGHKDSLVDGRNADFAKQLDTPSPIRVVDGIVDGVVDGDSDGDDFGHLVHLTHTAMVNTLLLELIADASTQSDLE